MQTFRYVTFHNADDYLRLGWVPRSPGLRGTHHGHWSILMEWICACECAWSRSGDRLLQRD